MMLLTLLPGSYVMKYSLINFPGFDKLVHFVLFFIFAILLYVSVFPSGSSSLTRYLPWIISILISMGYGAVIEYFQGYVPGRSSDIHDLLADTVGAISGILALSFLKRPGEKNPNP